MLTHLMFGLFSNICMIYLIRFHSNALKTGAFSGQNLLVLLILLSIVSASFFWFKYNESKSLPYHHPLFLFFNLLFSKAILVPAAVFPIGALLGQVFVGLVFINQTIEALIKIGVSFTLLLYLFSVLGSFIGVMIVNRRLMNEN